MNYKVSISSPFVLFFALMMMLMFWCREVYFNINNYRFLLIMTVLSGLFSIIFQIRLNRFKTNLWSWRWIVLAIIAVLASSYIFEKNSAPYYIAFIVLLLLFLFASSTIELKKHQVSMLIDAYLASSILMALILIVQHKTPYAAYGVYRFALYFSASSYYDVNFNALYFLMSSLLAYYLLQFATKQKRWFYTIAVILNIMSILLLGSRGSFLPVVGVIMIAMMKNRRISIRMIIVAVAVLVVLLYFLPEDVYERLIGTDYLSSESKRFIDWKYGWQAFTNHWLVGNGMLAPQDIVAELYSKTYVTYTIHNTYLVYLAQLGILGSIPFFFILLYPLYYFIKTRKNWYLAMSHLGFLFAIFMLEANYTYVFFVPMAITYVLICYDNNYLNGSCDILKSLSTNE